MASTDQQRVTPYAERHLVHGESGLGKWTPEYRAWANMLARCYNRKSVRFKDWGGRGISVSETWRHDFRAFLRDVGRKPSPSHSLDRFPDADGNYEPGNVRWATIDQQNRNKTSSVLLTFSGQTMTLVEWSEKTGINYKALHQRIRTGWPAERALSTPIDTAKGNRKRV